MLPEKSGSIFFITILANFILCTTVHFKTACRHFKALHKQRHLGAACCYFKLAWRAAFAQKKRELTVLSFLFILACRIFILARFLWLSSRLFRVDFPFRCVKLERMAEFLYLFFVCKRYCALCAPGFVKISVKLQRQNHCAVLFTFIKIAVSLSL